MSLQTQPKIWLTEKEAAEYLKCSPSTMKRWRRSNFQNCGRETPRSYSVGRKWLYEKGELDRWITGNRA